MLDFIIRSMFFGIISSFGITFVARGVMHLSHGEYTPLLNLVCISIGGALMGAGLFGIIYCANILAKRKSSP